MRKVEAILHPVRLRILQAFIGRKTLTVRDLADLLPDVPQATLYRHLGTLADAGVLQVVEERRVRGAVERVFALPDTSAALTGADLEGATPEDHLRYFATFLAALQGEFARYLGRPGIDLAADGVGYRTFTVNLTDEEFLAFMASLNELVTKAVSNPPAPGRRRRVFARVVMPLPEKD
ncbi:helix-turn-helix domain-containing protein [Streptosporangium sp. NPDC000396]|uniref:helix-turn-helix domain-containing protein n=1 Tax=Streptosporangium sp. NPDC000396 TaxID=3366185 RepID=UPI00369D64C7